MPNQDKIKASHKVSKAPRILKWALGCFGILLVAIVLFVGFVYLSSPTSIRNPKLEHYHFRMQIIVDGKAEDFSTEGYQTGYSKDQCNAKLPEQPIHFHDNKDQFTHIHWEGMTGGMVMKYYGWNFIGGLPDKLGFKLDKLTDPQPVTIHGNYLPKIPKDAKFYVYVGDANGYQERTFDEWKNQDLEKFFGTTSNFPAHEQNKQSSLLDKVFPKALAHGGADDGSDGEAGEETEEQKLTRINNLVGNVVIFVQKDPPSDEQIKDRFNKLEPLSDSTCGG